MKAQGRESGIWLLEKEEGKLDKTIQKALPKSDHIKESKLIQLLKPLLDKVTGDDLKIYQFEKAAREKVQFSQYPEVCNGNKQIFDVTGLFKTKSQVDSLCHLIGHTILQYLVIVRKDMPLPAFSKKFKERESIRNFRGMLAKMQNDVNDSLELLAKRTISEKAFEQDCDDFICYFEKEDQRKIAAKLVDDMIEEGALRRAQNRVSQTKHRNFEAKYSKMHEV